MQASTTPLVLLSLAGSLALLVTASVAACQVGNTLAVTTFENTGSRFKSGLTTVFTAQPAPAGKDE